MILKGAVLECFKKGGKKFFFFFFLFFNETCIVFFKFFKIFIRQFTVTERRYNKDEVSRLHAYFFNIFCVSFSGY